MTAPTSSSERLTALAPGMPIVYGGDRVALVSDELAAAFRPGDRLVVVQSTGALLHVPAAEQRSADEAVAAAARAFAALRPRDRRADHRLLRRASPPGSATTRRSARSPPPTRADVAAASAARALDDPARADARRMRADMVAGLRGWRDAAAVATQLVGASSTTAGAVEQRRAPLGVVGFVFEGRPNVFADATGVLRTGNTVVFRIGSRRARHGRGDRRARPRPGAGRGGAAAGRGRRSSTRRARRRLGAVLRPPAGAGRRARLGRGGRPAGRGRPPGRRPGQPARHGRGLARRRRRRPTPSGSGPPCATRSTARCATR